MRCRLERAVSKLARRLERRRILVILCVCVAAVQAAPVPAPAGTGDRDDSERSSRPELEIGRTPQYDYDPPEPGTYRLPAIMPAGDGAVMTPDGKRHRLHELLAGRVTLLSFIYTRCADPSACPVATGALYTIHVISEEDPLLEERLQLITFSFDPDHDTPTVMANYSRGLHPEDKGSDWLFLTTSSQKDLAPILSSYGQRVDRKSNVYDPLGPLYHLLRVYLIDDERMVRNIYSFGLLDPRMVLTDVRTLLMEDTARSAGE